MTFLEGLKLKFFSSRIFPPFSTVFAMKLSKMSKSIPFSLRIVATDDRYDCILEIFSFFERISHSTNLMPVFDDWLLFGFKLFIEQKAFQTFQAVFIQRQLAEEYTAEIRGISSNTWGSEYIVEMRIRVICKFTSIFKSTRVGRFHTCLVLFQPGPLGAAAWRLVRILHGGGGARLNA